LLGIPTFLISKSASYGRAQKDGQRLFLA
jgi:hypothetical protein